MRSQCPVTYWNPYASERTGRPQSLLQGENRQCRGFRSSPKFGISVPEIISLDLTDCCSGLPAGRGKYFPPLRIRSRLCLSRNPNKGATTATLPAAIETGPWSDLKHVRNDAAPKMSTTSENPRSFDDQVRKGLVENRNTRGYSLLPICPRLAPVSQKLRPLSHPAFRRFRPRGCVPGSRDCVRVPCRVLYMRYNSEDLPVSRRRAPYLPAAVFQTRPSLVLRTHVYVRLQKLGCRWGYDHEINSA